MNNRTERVQGTSISQSVDTDTTRSATPQPVDTPTSSPGPGTSATPQDVGSPSSNPPPADD